MNTRWNHALVLVPSQGNRGRRTKPHVILEYRCGLGTERINLVCHLVSCLCFEMACRWRVVLLCCLWIGVGRMVVS